ncbi:retrovirus-related pol polyprotein from transposon TNT 1-94 [Tanacetum coccineum]
METCPTLAEYQDYNGGPVAFGGSKGYISGKDTECLVLSPDFKLPNENQVLLRVSRQNNMYSFNLENIVPSGGLACLIAKATVDESNKWHRRLGHVNFKNINKLVKGNLVRVILWNLWGQKGSRGNTVCQNSTNKIELLMKETACEIENQANITCRSKESNHMQVPTKIKNFDAGNSKMEVESAQDYFVLPIWSSYTLTVKSSKAKNKSEKSTKNTDLKTNEKPVDQEDQAFLDELERLKRQEKEANDAVEALRKEFAKILGICFLQAGAARASSTNTVNTASTPVSIASPSGGLSFTHLTNTDQDDLEIPDLEDSYDNPNDGIFTNASYDDEGVVADFTNLETIVNLSEALEDESCVDAMQEELLQFKIHKSLDSCRFALWEESNWDKMGLQNKKCLFSYGIIDEEVYVSQPPGFVDPKYPKKVYKVMKALYGLHQAPRACYLLLGLQVKHPPLKEDGIFISHDKYVAEILKKFDFASVKTASTPVETQKPLVKDGEVADVDVHLYRSMNGSLMYLTASRPDIMFVVCAYSRFQVALVKGRQYDLLYSLYEVLCEQKDLDHDDVFHRVLWVLEHLDAKKKFVMYPRFISVFLATQLKNVHVPLDHFPINALTSKVLSFMVKKGKNFSGNVTPLFDSMLVQPTEDEGEASERPSESQPIPSPPHLSEDQPESQLDPSPRPSPSIPVPDSNPEGSGRNHGGQSSSDRSLLGNEDGLTLQSVYDLCISLCKQVTLQAKEIKDLKAQIKKLKKKARPGRKTAKSKPTAHKDQAFDDLDDFDAMDFMEDGGMLIIQNKAKQKGVEIKDAEDFDRPRPTSTRSLLTLKPLPKIDPKDKGKKVLEEEAESDAESKREEKKKLVEEEATKVALIRDYDDIHARIEVDSILAARLQEEEREKFTIEERAKLLHNTIAAQRRFLTQQRAAEIKRKKHSDLKTKNFEEIQVLYEKVKRSDENFIAIGSAEDERLIKDVNKKATGIKKDDSIKEESKEEETLDEDKVMDYEILDREYPIIEWKTKYHGFKPQYDETKDLEEIRLNVVIRSNGQRRYFSTLMRVLSIFDKEDLNAVYKLVMNRYQDEIPEGFDRVLWGDLMIMFNPSNEDEFWNLQQDWNVVSWKLHGSLGVHTLMTEAGLVIHMFVEKKYPLRKKVLLQMPELKLESEEDSTMALELIRFVKKVVAELEPENLDGDGKDL